MTQHIYPELMTLVASDESFYSKDHVLDGKTYRVFSYRLASWSAFQRPSALHCRGIMYDVTDPENPKLVSFPMDKFFNVGEGGFDYSDHAVDFYMEKLDGSLISTYLHNGEVRLKSKTSLNSEQASDAMRWFNAPENHQFKDYVSQFVEGDFTVSMEITSGKNRIVVGYNEEKLTILSIRDNKTGHLMISDDTFEKHFHVKGHQTELPYPAFEKSVEGMRDIEGFVIHVRKPNGETYFVKKKTEWYSALHKTKDSISSDKKLFECVIGESSDDLRSLFANDEYTMKRVTEMENSVIPKFNHLIKSVEDFYVANKELSRKDYALKGQKEAKEFFPLVMELYVGREPDFKAFAIKNQKEYFGVSDKVYGDADS
jgi:T4 RnlA family RNA ligase